MGWMWAAQGYGAFAGHEYAAAFAPVDVVLVLVASFLCLAAPRFVEHAPVQSVAASALECDLLEIGASPEVFGCFDGAVRGGREGKLESTMARTVTSGSGSAQGPLVTCATTAPVPLLPTYVVMPCGGPRFSSAVISSQSNRVRPRDASDSGTSRPTLLDKRALA